MVSYAASEKDPFKFFLPHPPRSFSFFHNTSAKTSAALRLSVLPRALLSICFFPSLPFCQPFSVSSFVLIIHNESIITTIRKCVNASEFPLLQFWEQKSLCCLYMHQSVRRAEIYVGGQNILAQFMKYL